MHSSGIEPEPQSVNYCDMLRKLIIIIIIIIIHKTSEGKIVQGVPLSHKAHSPLQRTPEKHFRH
jgi:hypothetical protein